MKNKSTIWQIAYPRALGVATVLALLFGLSGVSGLLGTMSFVSLTYASQLTLISATASSSAPSVNTNYVFRYTTTNTITSGSTTVITLDPTTLAFDLTTLTANDINVTGFTKVNSCTGGPTDEATVTITPDTIMFTTCGAGDSIPPGAKVITLSNNRVTNPSSPGSYIVRINGTMTDSGDTRVAIISAVTMTGIINTNLTFTIAGVASSSSVNGDTTSTSTTATAIAFGSLSVGTSSVAAQDLSVTTNALNGFSVTLTENQDLTSNNGATINAFKDGNAVTGAPVAWTTPTGVVGSPNTYGHMGVSSEDATLPSGDEFGSQLYAGLISTSTRTVLYHTAPADGTTANIGATRVGFRVQITALQEAATDYNNVLTYVCTPIF